MDVVLVLSSWIDSSHALLLGLLALAGLVFAIKNELDRRWRAELYLCYWLTEHCSFLTRRTPPSGMELADSQKLTFPLAFAASLYILPRTELAKRVQAGMFSTVQTCSDEDDERLQVLGVPPLYRQKADIHGCTIFWDRVPTASQNS